MFYITEKLDTSNGQSSYVPLQVASSWEEGIELVASVAEVHPTRVLLGIARIDIAGNVFQFASVPSLKGFIDYRITELRRS